MQKVYYRKLIRDNIPEKIRAKGSLCEVRHLSRKEFEHELLKKIEEESRGVRKVLTRDELKDELADLLAVIRELQALKKITPSEMKTAIKDNLKKKGRIERKGHGKGGSWKVLK